MTLADAAFAAVAAMTLAGAFLAVGLKNVFYNALALILCLFGVAGLFIFLNSEFLAVMEVIIYIGAVSIAIIFAIMLSRPMARHEAWPSVKVFRAGLVSLLAMAAVWKALSSTAWPQAPAETGYSIHGIGKMLLGPQVLAFEAVSLILLVAIIGALVVSGTKGSK